MKAILFLLVLPAIVGAQGAAPTLREFRIDASHSTVEFSVPFLGHAVRGRFDDVKGLIVHAPGVDGGPGASAVTIVIGAASISTGSQHRDEHLRSDDFFDVAAYPHIVFASTGIAGRDSNLVMTGRLTMHGVTRVVRIPFRASGGPVDDPHGSTLVHFHGATRIARRDFGIIGGARHNDWFDTIRSATMGDSVDITLDVQGWRTDFARTKRFDPVIADVVARGTASSIARVRDAIAKNPVARADMEFEVDQVGAALLHAGRTKEAVEMLTFNVELYPNSPNSWAALGRAHEMAGALDLARSSAARALALDAVHPRALELQRRVGQPAL